MPRPRKLAAVAVPAVIAGVLAARGARADVEPVRVDYEAHEGCPGQGDFFDQLKARTSRARAASAGEEALDVRVRITTSGEGSRGRITLGRGAEARARSVDGASCEEVVAALSLITALAIDPEASLEPLARPSAREPKPGREGEAREGEARAGEAREGEAREGEARKAAKEQERAPDLPREDAPPKTPTAVAAPPSKSTNAPNPPTTARPAKLRSTLGLQASAAFDVTPRALLGGGPFVEVEVELAAADVGLGASFRFAVEVAATGTIDLGPGSARFTRSIARLDACPALLRATRWLTLEPCIGAEGGLLRGEGLPGPRVDNVERATVPWASLGALARAAVSLGDVARIDVQGGPAFPLVRRSFVFENPAFVIHEVPAVTWTLHLGVGPTFW